MIDCGSRGGNLLRCGEIAFSEGNDPALDTEQPADIEMFSRLWLNRFVGCHDQQHCLNSAGSGEHVSNKPLVARNVDKAHTVAARQGQMSKTKIDGYPTPFLFCKTIGIHTSQSPNKRGFAVVDVSGGPDNNVLGSVKMTI